MTTSSSWEVDARAVAASISNLIGVVPRERRLTDRLIDFAFDPAIDGTAQMSMLVSSDEVILEAGHGMRFEMEALSSSAPEIIELAQSVAAGRLVEEVGTYRVRFTTQRPDGESISGASTFPTKFPSAQRGTRRYRPYPIANRIASDETRNEPVPPIIVDENGDIDFFPSVVAAAQKVEAIDVLNDEYEFFDSRGRRLVAWATDKWAPVRIDPTDDFDREELTRRLRACVQRLGGDRVGIADPGIAEHDELVRALAAFHKVDDQVPETGNRFRLNKLPEWVVDHPIGWGLIAGGMFFLVAGPFNGLYSIAFVGAPLFGGVNWFMWRKNGAAHRWRAAIKARFPPTDRD